MELVPDLNSLVNPQSICIVGASEKSLFVKNIVVNLESQGFAGQLYMVNPKYKTIFGHVAYPSVLEIPGPIDNAVFLISAKFTLEALKQCVQKGVKSITIITSGFAENGRTEGSELQQQIKEIARKNNILICGPNCFGTISSHGQVANFGEKIPGRLGKGNIGVVMQSGGLLNAFINLSQSRSVDFSYLVSSGNEAVLEAADYIRFMLDDPHTDVICGFIEGIQDKEKFSAVAGLALARKKPIILIKIGRSDNGAEVAFRHTGAVTGSEAEFNQICKETGIIRVDDLEDLIETASLFAKVLHKWPLVGRRIGAITVSGGGAGLIADIGWEEGFVFPQLSERTTKALTEIVPEFGFVANPLDLTAQVFGNPDHYLKCAEYLMDEEELDVIAFVTTLGVPKQPHPAAAIIEGVSGIVKKTNKLCVFFSVADMGLNEWGRDLLKKCDLPFLHGARRAFKAINSLIEYDKLLPGSSVRG